MSVATSYLTPPAVAERYGVDVHKILSWIKRGELHAINVGDGDRRPRYRVSPAELALFEARRSSAPQPKIVRQRRKNPAVKEFF